MLEIQKNVKLSDYSTFKIGGPAKEFVEVKNENELIESIEYAGKNNLKIFVLGSGSNVLFSDNGFDGLIIRIQDIEYKIQENLIECGAGLQLSKLLNLAKENNLSGLEWAAGIPGTVGGAIRGNCGAFGENMAGVVSEVKVLNIDESKISDYKSQDCKFGYRDSIFKKNKNLIIISAKISLKKGNQEEIEFQIKELLEKRMKKQPSGWTGSAGSFFINPVVENKKLIERYEKDTGNKVVENRIPAGWLIEEAGFKGKKIGGMMVDEKNGNFLINTGSAKSEEVIMLSSIIKQKIRNEFGVQLKEEVQIIF